MSSATSGRRWLALAAATLIFALGPAATQAFAGSYFYTVHVVGSGTVTGPNNFSCTSTALSDGVEGTTCPLTLGFPVWPGEATYYLSATPGSTPGDNWRFSDADDNLADGGWTGCHARRSDHPNQCRIWLEGTLDPTKNVSRDVYAYFDDYRGPVVTIDDGPQSTLTHGAATFAVSSPDADTGELWCRLDGGGESKCGTGTTGAAGYSVGNGQHTFSVRGKDQSGNWGAAKERTWTVDLPPETSLAPSGPAQGSLRSDRTATFSFSSPSTDVGPGGFDCRLDGPGGHGWQACQSPVSYSGLGDGSFTFSVRARDVTSADPSPASRSWAIDTEPPETEITSGPTEGAVLSVGTASFGYRTGLSEPSTTTFSCSVDGRPFEDCPGSAVAINALRIGDHVFAVRARDAAGNADPTPATRHWRVTAIDADGDGVVPPADCDDTSAAIFPGARDLPDDGIDQDCNGRDAENFDRDADGFQRPGDCDDRDPAIRPGIRDTPQDGIDNNCDGVDDAWPRLTTGLAWSARVRGARTELRKLELAPVLAGSRIEVRCAGRGCPKRRATLGGTGTVKLKPFVKARLHAGARLDIRVLKEGYVGVVKRITVLRDKDPRIVSKCMMPGAGKPTAC
jgi:hypothetical protein